MNLKVRGVGAILRRTSDFAPNLYEEDEKSEEEYRSTQIKQSSILSSFWDHLHSSPIPADRTHFKAAKEITGLFTYSSDIVTGLTCSMQP